MMPYFMIRIQAMDALIMANDLKNGNNNKKNITESTKATNTSTKQHQSLISNTLQFNKDPLLGSMLSAQCHTSVILS